MTIDWGSYDGPLRLGHQWSMSPATVTPETASVTVTLEIWENTSGWEYYGDNQTIHWSGTQSGSEVHNCHIGDTEPNTVLRKTINYVVNTVYGSTVVVTANTFLDGVSGTYAGITPDKNSTFTVPARPFDPPAAPTIGTATRVNDTQASITWTRHATTGAPYTNMKVYRHTNGGSPTLIATLAGSATSYSDTTTSVNNRYAYHVQATNSAGSSTVSSDSNTIYMTPRAPTIGTATKLGNGNIRVTWTNTVAYGNSQYTTRVEHSSNGGSSWSELTGVAAGVTSYEHVSPGTGTTHTYRVRARSSVGSLNSAYSSNSNTVTLLSNANAPTGLSADQQAFTSGTARDASQDITFRWTHNPTDGTPQSKYTFRHSIDGGSTWTTVGPTTSGVSSYTLLGGARSNGGSTTLTWQVATAGENGTVGAFSASSTIQLRSRPTVTPTAVSPDPYTDASVTPAWTYAQVESLAQATYTLKLYDVNDNVLEQINGTGTDASRALTYTLENGQTYKFGIVVTSSVGMSSAEGFDTFSVVFLVPALGYVLASYDADSGTMVLTVTGDDGDGLLTDDIDTVSIERQINGGTWVTIAEGIVLADVAGTLTAIVLDTTCAIIGTDTYRITTHAASGTANTNSTTVDNIPTAYAQAAGWSFLSTGDGFGDIVRMRAMPTFKASKSRDRALHHFAGRPKPVQLTGEAEDLELSISGLLIETSSTAEEFEAIATTDGVVLWRAITGRRVFGSIGKVETQTKRAGIVDVSFNVAEVDYPE